MNLYDSWKMNSQVSDVCFSRLSPLSVARKKQPRESSRRHPSKQQTTPGRYAASVNTAAPHRPRCPARTITPGLLLSKDTLRPPEPESQTLALNTQSLHFSASLLY